ncbi:organomercurial lyase [Streptomyces sp. NRRL F-2580]|uniref:organomercurial lyase n=1 Tax=Streptomyces sp. NRRL F-2580 TaxID=1463841 RepID=UPI0004C88660|nr:organomercurial lyase [Streptomyces sp. NRRL F-2580]
MQLQGQQVHGWCAMDVPRCAATGEPITLTVTPGGVHDLSPSTAAVTPAPATGAGIREVFCDRVNFHATADLAEAVVERDGDLAAARSTRPGTSASAWPIFSDLLAIPPNGAAGNGHALRALFTVPPTPRP